MDTYIEDTNTILPQVFSHLSQLAQQPTQPIDADLLRRAERSLTPSTPHDRLWSLLSDGEDLLKLLLATSAQDVEPLTSLLTATIKILPNDELKTKLTPEKLCQGLNATASPPVQLLCIAYLDRLASSPSGVAWVARDTALSQQLLATWLGTEDTGVSNRALECLVELLVTDSPDTTTFISSSSSNDNASGDSGEAYGIGLLWRRLFRDKGCYESFFRYTTLRDNDGVPLISAYDLSTAKGRARATISQGRLFDFLARAAEVDFVAISTSALPDVERPYIGGDNEGQDAVFGGLLNYAANHMIDKEDIILEVLRVECFQKIAEVLQASGNNGVQRNVPLRTIEAIQSEGTGGF